MAIRPPSDIVLDVARAADPARMSVALRRLTAGSGAEFADLVGGSAARPAGAPAGPADIAARLSAMAWPGTEAAVTTDPYRKFEAFMLQTFIQEMMPKDGAGTFGKGTAGSIYGAMLAEQIANGFARHGGIGIAKQLAAHAALQASAEASP